MDLKELRRSWDAFGKLDPLWAILRAPGKKGRRWESAEFFATGQQEISGVMERVDRLPMRPRRGVALDFGCGVGRVTQALASYFDEVVGVDIAPSMVRLAEQYNRHGGKCRYVVNDREDLGLFPDSAFDFVYSNITLQHMEPRYALGYIREFLRVLGPGGVAVFQLPSEPLPWLMPFIGLASAVLGWYCRVANGPRMEVFGIRRGEVTAFLLANGGKVLDIRRHDAVKGWRGYDYSVAKDPGG
ncbi:MAG: class I SAM-dependent methyltransferase [Chloroflexi bacterium]|nr:class I SAM-dependent methyltransferase [Chloroflexota bacterium]